jgi:pSer/pThr/pTyr-binding forkhead associated (FHA) protein
MDALDLNTILFVGKWVFIGLIYLILMLVVISVRREMASQTLSRRSTQVIAPGRLLVLDPGGDKRIRPGKSLHLQTNTSLGTGSENDIVLGDPYISGRHAQLTWDGAAWWIEDLGSSNGTQIDGTPCPPHVPCRVASGARLLLGEMVFELRI